MLDCLLFLFYVWTLAYQKKKNFLNNSELIRISFKTPKFNGEVCYDVLTMPTKLENEI